MRSEGFFPKFIRTLIFVMGFSLSAFAANSGITYQGRILKSDNSPLNGQFVQFKMQVRSPDANDCLLYEETSALLDMRTSNGGFAVTMHDGTGTRTDTSGYTFEKIFSNITVPSVPVVYNFGVGGCTTNSSYTPAANDGRNLVVLFKDESMALWEPIPAVKLNYVPYALEATQVSGFGVESLIRVQESSGALGSVSPLSNVQYNKILDLAAGKLSGQTLPTLANGQVLGWAAGTWAAVTPVVGTGTVTRVDTGTGLTGGGFTTTGTISILAGGVSATELAADAVTSPKILNANVTLAKLAGDSVDSTKIVDGSVGAADLATDAVTTAKILNANVTLAKLAADSVDSSKIVNGTIAGADLDPAVNITTSGTVVTGALTTRDFRIYQPSSGNAHVGFTADPLTSSYYVQLPAAQGGAGTTLVNNGSGTLIWGTPSGAGITSLTGDVTGSGSGAVATTIVANAVTTGKILNANVTLAKMAADSVDSSKIVDGSVATADIDAKAITYGKIQDISASNRLLGRATTGAGITEEITIGTGLSITGTTLNNTVTDTDTFAAVTAACANTFVPYKSGGVWTCLQATDSNANSTLVERDAFGSFAGNVATVNGLTLKNSGSLLNIVSPSGGAWTMTLPATAGSNGEVLTTKGSGLLSWAAAGGSSQWTTQAPGINYMAGNVGIGTTQPSEKLQVAGNVVAQDYLGLRMMLLDGSKVAPAFTFLSDDTLGIFRNASGGLGVAIGGQEVTSFDSSGKVGIGTTAPNAALDVKGSVVMSGATSGYTGFQAPATAGSLIYTLPATAPTNGQVLSSTSGGVTSWITPTGGGMTSLTGDVTGTGSGAVATTIAADAVTTGKILDGTVATADLASSAVTYAKIQNISATNRLLGRATAGAGVTEEITIGTGLSLTGTTLNNTVTDTFAAVTTACANTFVPYKSGGVWTCLQATDSNTNSTLVERDAFGSFAANVATVNGLTLKNSGSLLNIVSPSGGAWTMTLPATAGSNGQVLTTNGSGLLSWAAAGGSSQWTTHGSNISYDGGGKVGIGTTAPTASLQIEDATSASLLLRNVNPTGNPTSNIFLANYRGSWGGGDPAIVSYASNGLPGSEGPLNTDQVFLSLQGRGYSEPGFWDGVPSGYIEMRATSAWGGGGNKPSYMVFGTGTSERMRITNDGKVGIGTTLPTSKLDVNGNVNLSSSTEAMTDYVSISGTHAIPDTSVNVRQLTLTGNTAVTLPVFSSAVPTAYSLTVFVKQDGTGGRTISFVGSGSDNVKWDSGTAPTISSTLGKITILNFLKPSHENICYGSMVWKEN